jgi:hypothetical protein
VGRSPKIDQTKQQQKIESKIPKKNDNWISSETPEATGISRASVCTEGISQSNLQVCRFVHLCGSVAEVTVRLGCGPASLDNQCPVFWDNMGVYLLDSF